MSLNPTIHQENDITKGLEFLKQLVHYRTYSNVLPDGRKENREETVNRSKEMFQDNFPKYKDEIEEAFRWVHNGYVVPSMRVMQFAGDPILKSNPRAYNCSFSALTSFRDFSDLFWLLMNGVGAGFSVQKRHIDQLPLLTGKSDVRYAIPDTREGWAESFRKIIENPLITFDYALIRPKGSLLSTGGTASGPDSLREMHEKVRKILLKPLSQGRKLSSLECHDIMCLAADVVVVGGVRRSALLSMFDPDDMEMLSCKNGDWWIENGQRARANNSAALYRKDPNLIEKLHEILDMCFKSGYGEPGVILTNDLDYGRNPCSEINLRSSQLCNLSEVNLSKCKNSFEFIMATRAASLIGTLQATYTDFPYIQNKWKENCEEEALLGVSITGQAQNWNLITEKQHLKEAAKIAVLTNKIWARKIGINQAARVTTIKPSGTTSSWLGTTSGIHAAHSPFYLRRVRLDRKDEFAQHLINTFGESEANSGGFIERDLFSSENTIVTVPISMTNAIQRNEESAVSLLKRTKFVYDNWILPGHRSGPDTHSVSLTVSYKKEEESDVADWMIQNTDSWASISLLPDDGGNYQQAPFEEITEKQFNNWLEKVPDLDFSAIRFERNNHDDKLSEVSCAGGACNLMI